MCGYVQVSISEDSPLPRTEETPWAGMATVGLWEDIRQDLQMMGGLERRSPHSKGCREESQRGVTLEEQERGVPRSEALEPKGRGRGGTRTLAFLQN